MRSFTAIHQSDGDVRAVKAVIGAREKFPRLTASYHCNVLGSPLNGPTISLVTQPP